MLDVLRCIGSALAPRACAGCHTPLGPHPEAGLAGVLCGRCLGGLPWVESGCPTCGREQGPHAAPGRCASCRRTRRGAVRRTTALLRYRGLARTLLHRLKYNGRDELAPALGAALGRRLLAAGAVHPRALVVPVPLHPWRRYRRGFNQAEALAEALAAVVERPHARAIVRRRATRPLYGVPREAREEVLTGAFAARRRQALAGRPVLLVDDIRTNGATLRAAAEALRAAGAGRISAAVVAR